MTHTADRAGDSADWLYLVFSTSPSCLQGKEGSIPYNKSVRTSQCWAEKEWGLSHRIWDKIRDVAITGYLYRESGGIVFLK